MDSARGCHSVVSTAYEISIHDPVSRALERALTPMTCWITLESPDDKGIGILWPAQCYTA